MLNVKFRIVQGEQQKSLRRLLTSTGLLFHFLPCSAHLVSLQEAFAKTFKSFILERLTSEDVCCVS